MWQNRQQSVLKMLKELGAVMVLPTQPEHLRCGDSHFRYRTNSDFFYLTGFDEPESVAVFNPFHPEHQFVLFVRPRDPEMETWHGRRAGLKGAIERFSADMAYSIEDIDEHLPELLAGASNVYFPLGIDPKRDAQLNGAIGGMKRFKRQGYATPLSVSDLSTIVHEMRLFKEDGELEIMQTAADITAEAHIQAMKATKPGKFEYEIEALIEYTFRRRGGVGPAYPSIVGGGDNGTILHYVENSSELKAGDLLLVDAGCEYGYYSSDVTRTWPISGKFTGAQREAYEIVLASQLAAIDTVRPGQAFSAAHDAAVNVLAQGMLDLKLLKGSLDEVIETEAYKAYYMHKTGHWLGLDVHDAGEYYPGSDSSGRSSRSLEAGMVTTVEPGLYVPASDEKAPKALRGMGIRIEDDVLVTKGDPRVLTAACPKTIQEIEALVGTLE